MFARINTSFTNEHFAAWCQQMVGQPYWYGTVVYKCTESLRSRKAKQYPTHYQDSSTARYKQDIAAKKVCADCIGGAKGYAWTNGGVGVLEAIGTDNKISSKYGANSCPDKGANSMFTYAKNKGMDWGTIDTLPEIVGLALHKDGHVGYYIGGGYAIEWRGFAYGCVKTKVTGRSWKCWYKLPFIQYDDTGAVIPPTPVDVPLGSRLLKKGDTGADGDFGNETKAAVIAFQEAEGLEQDGKYGAKSHAALMEAVADDDEGQQDTPEEKPEETPDDQPEAKPVGTTLVIVSEGGKVNARVGNDTSFARISSIAPGATFEYIATAANGWHAVVIGAQIGWVSGKYSRII